MNGFCEVRDAVPTVVPARAARLPAFIGATDDIGSRLDRLKVVVVGVGSVGRSMALHLARLQVGALWLVDRGAYKAESLLTQPITPDEVGAPKASRTAALCRALSPRTRVYAFDGPVEELDEATPADADVWLLASDNLAAEVEVGLRCQRLGRPLIHAAVHGDTLTAQVRTFGNRDGSGPCPACAFGAVEWSLLSRETVFSCQGAETGQTEKRLQNAPTRSVSFLCGLAAELALMQLLRLTLGLGAPVDDTLTEYCGYTHRTVVSPLRRNPECPCDHLRWVEVPPPRPLADCSLRDLCGAVGLPAERTSVTVAGRTFATEAFCEPCGRTRPLRRFVSVASGGRTCPGCGGRARVSPFHCHRPAPAAVLAPIVDWPLRDLRAADAPWLLLRSDEQALLFRAEHRGGELS